MANKAAWITLELRALGSIVEPIQVYQGASSSDSLASAYPEHHTGS